MVPVMRKRGRVGKNVSTVRTVSTACTTVVWLRVGNMLECIREVIQGDYLKI